MIKIDCDSVLFGDGNGKVEACIKAKGPRKNLSYEIYAIMKWFETNCRDPYIDALDRVCKE